MYQPQYGTYQQPQRKRGMKRIVLGILGILANVVGLVVMPFLAGVAVMVITVLAITPVSLGTSSGTFEASSTSIHYVYVPTAEASSATCALEGGTDATWEPEDENSMSETIDGVAYTEIGMVTVTSDQQVTITCDGAEDIAVADVAYLWTFAAAALGIVVPVALGLLALVLLIWGIVARVRS